MISFGMFVIAMLQFTNRDRDS
ncbi:hypothetical protein [Cytobacillus pseudoceanisediminis]